MLIKNDTLSCIYTFFPSILQIYNKINNLQKKLNTNLRKKHINQGKILHVYIHFFHYFSINSIKSTTYKENIKY